VPSSLDSSTNVSSDPLELALMSASACSFIGPPHLESEAFSTVLDSILTCHVSTVVHVPRSVCPG